MKQTIIKEIKRKCAILICVLTIIITAIPAYAGEAENLEQDTQANIQRELSVPDAIKEEGGIAADCVRRLPDAETNLNTIVYENTSGNQVMYLFEKDVKYIDESGIIKDKSTTFEISGNMEYAYENGDNDVKLYLKEYIRDGIEVKFGDSVIRMSVENAENNEKVILRDNAAVYEEVFGNGTSVNYKPLLNGIKEEIILDYYTGQTEFNFTVATGDYILAKSDDNCLYLKDRETGETVGIIDSVYMIDNAGKTDFHSYYEYEELSYGIYSVTACLNKGFLESADTEYPVIVDPTITISKNASPNGIYDATINSKAGSDGASGSLYVGNRGTEYGDSRIVMKFPNLFSSNKVSVVLNASISIRDLMCESTSMSIKCHPLLAAPVGWNENYVSWSLLWMNSSGAYHPNIYASNTISYSNGVNQSEAHRYEFNITNIVDCWRRYPSGTYGSPDKGIMFKADSANSGVYKTFGSYNRASYNPVFKMEYVPYNGGFTAAQFEGLRTEQNMGTSKVFFPNCLGLALFDAANITQYHLGLGNNLSLGNITTFTNAVLSYINKGNCYKLAKAEFLGFGLKSTYTLSSNQYIVALRVMTDGSDFHAVAQMNNGQWINKHGTIYEIEQLGYINPDNTVQPCWKGQNGKYYNSQTAYIRITIK